MITNGLCRSNYWNLLVLFIRSMLVSVSIVNPQYEIAAFSINVVTCIIALLCLTMHSDHIETSSYLPCQWVVCYNLLTLYHQQH